MKYKLMTRFINFFFPKAAAVSLYPFGIYFLKEEYMKNLELVNHEKIHIKQQKEMLVIFFYIWYVIEWIFKRYINISFEKEVYHNDFNYLDNRKKFNWIKYYKIK